MTQSVVVIDPSDGSEIDYTANYRPDKGMEIGGEAFNGETDSGGTIVFDDTAGLIVNRDDLAHGRRLIIREDASGVDKPLHMGRISPRSQYRDIEVADRARSITITTRDQNADLSGIVVDGWSRPAEEPFERIQALLAAYLNGASSTEANADASNGIWGRDSTVIGDGFVNTTPIGTDMPAKDYVETDPREVIRDCCEWAGFDAFVILNDDETLDLFFDDRTGTAYTSTLSISDNDAQVDDTLCFAPIWDLGPAHELDGSEQATGLLLIGGNERRTYDSRPAVEVVNDKWEYVDRSEATEQADLNNNLVALLNSRQEEELRIQFSIKVPADSVHLLRPGMRMEVKRAYAAGIGTPTYFRAVQVRYRWISHEYYMVGVYLGYPVKLVRRYGQGRTIPTAPEPSTPPTPGACTRYYFTGDTTGIPTVARDASWDKGNSDNGMSVQVGLLKTSPAAAGTSSWGLGTTSVPINFHHGQFFLQLSGTGTLSGFVKAMIGARRRTGVGVTSGQRHQAQMVIRIVSSDGSTVRGTLLAAHEPGSLDSAFFQSTMQSIKFPASSQWTDEGAALASVGYQDNDWIVVEAGTHTVVDGGGTGAAINWEGTMGQPDFPEEEFVPVADGVSWIDICAAGTPGTTGNEPEPVGSTPSPGTPGTYAPIDHVHGHDHVEYDGTIDHDAESVAYDNTLSGLTADNVQDAIDEAVARIETGTGGFESGALSNPPTAAEVEALIGSPGSVPAGTVYGIEDSATAKRYLALSDMLRWYIVPLVNPLEQAGTVILTSSPDGGWSGGQPSAAYYNGVTYFAYIDGGNGNAELRTYTHSSGVVSSPTVMRAALDTDSHAGPTVLIRDSDKRVFCVYSAHSGSAIYRWVSTNPEDISAGTETNIDSQLGGTAYGYKSLVEIDDGIMLVCRPVAEATGQNWAYSVSTNDGVTFPTLTSFYAIAGRTAYLTIRKTAANRVDVVASDGNSLEANTSIIHFYYDAGTWRDSAGGALTLPIGSGDATTVWDGSAGDDAYSRDDVTIGSDGYARVLFTVDLGGGSYAYRHGRWTGSAWVTTVVDTYADQPAGIRFDSLNPSVLYGCVDGELFRYTTLDEATWTSTSTGITGTNVLYPVSPTDHAADLPVIVLVGTFTSTTSFALGIAGFGADTEAADVEHLQRVVFLDNTTLGEAVLRRTSLGAWEISRNDGADWESLGSTSSSTGIGPILISDTPAGVPLVFGDLLQNDAGTDLLYADL